jgi:hypothetical protein
VKIVVKVIRTLIGLGVVAGLCYSVSALKSQSVYASSCNCSAEQLEAEQFCLTQCGSQQLSSFVCIPSAGEVIYNCARDSVHRQDFCNDD